MEKKNKTGRHIVLGIFGGIVLLGLILAIVGLALGGRPGGIRAEDGEFVYYSGGERTAFAPAPRWMDESWWIMSTGWAYDDTPAVANGASGGSPASGGTAAAGGSRYEAAPFAAGQLKGVKIDIAAGYLEVKTGPEPGLTVDGPMDYTSSFQNGEWSIVSRYRNISVRSVGGKNRYWWQGQDITTTFTLTLPESFGRLDVSIDMGEAAVRGFTLDKLDCETDLGSLTIENVKAAKAELDVDLGEINAVGMEVSDCSLDCDLGSLTYEGAIDTRLEATCSLGGITVKTPRPASYSGSAEVDLGAITVDGRGVRSGDIGESFASPNHGHSPVFELECGLGSIEVVFTS